jgi:hypothetical protein
MGFIYRVEIAGELYVGSTKVRLLCNRQKQHNYNLRTPIRKAYNTPLYVFCREHNVKKIICEVIEMVDNENIKIAEQKYIDLLQPSLNTYRAFRTEEQKIEQKKECDKKYKEKKYYENYKKKIY